MIPMFREQEVELTMKFEKLKSLKDELKTFKEAEGMTSKPKVQP